MKKITLTLTAILATFLLVACGSDKKNSTARTGTYNGTIPGLACNGCSNTNRLGTALGLNDRGDVSMAMEFFAANQNDNENYNYDYGSYSGPVDGVGRLSVATSISCGSTNTGRIIDYGHYDVIVKGYGQMDPISELISGMQVEAHGNNRIIRMTLLSASLIKPKFEMISCDGNAYPLEMVAQWRIESVNGTPCGNSIILGGKGVFDPYNPYGNNNNNQNSQLICP